MSADLRKWKLQDEPLNFKLLPKKDQEFTTFKIIVDKNGQVQKTEEMDELSQSPCLSLLAFLSMGILKKPLVSVMSPSFVLVVHSFFNRETNAL